MMGAELTIAAVVGVISGLSGVVAIYAFVSNRARATQAVECKATHLGLEKDIRSSISAVNESVVKHGEKIDVLAERLGAVDSRLNAIEHSPIHNGGYALMNTKIDKLLEASTAYASSFSTPIIVKEKFNEPKQRRAFATAKPPRKL